MKYLNHSLWYALIMVVFSQNTFAEVFRKQYSSPALNQYLVVEILDNDLIHFELSAVGAPPGVSSPLYTSPMIFKNNYSGPSSITETGNTLRTPDITLTVNNTTLCISARDRKNADALLSTICPANLSNDWKGLNIAPTAIKQVYGLGQQFKQLASSDGDWISHGIRQAQPAGQAQAHGNGFMPFGQAGLVGNVQFPIMYALGDNNLQYALFIDNVYKRQWDFTTNPWQVRMWGDQIRFYLITGENLADLRSDYMELTGRPPVPPRKSLGLWVSEFGYRNWDEIDTLATTLRDNNFPVDGFVLDLFWFGGIKASSPDSAMGRLDWDSSNTDGNDYYFPEPDSHIRALADNHLGLIAIEESYISLNTSTYAQMQSAGHYFAYARSASQCNPAIYQPISLSDWFGQAAMVDWSNSAGARWLHNNRRFPNLISKGIYGHWTDLGEPEKYDGNACYNGVETTASGIKNTHGDLHNLYALLWVKSIFDGYYEKRDTLNNRPFIMTRSGAPGIQRFGAAFWSGDIGANLDLLASHANAQMHMSFSGIDYYGADVGGFRREGLPYNNNHSGNRQYEDEMYSQWFANAAWFDIPVRPHTDNAFQTAQDYKTEPHQVGDTATNLANIRRRYALLPYYYSLAHRANLYGEPLIPPLVFYYQNDKNVRTMGHQKLIGKDILVGIVARHGEYERDIYLPAGEWFDYHSNEWFSSSGEWLSDIPVYREGLLTLPAFVKAGAILPQMWVDADTLDAFGHQKSTSPVHNELIINVYNSDTPSHFTLYEDDGTTRRFNTDKTSRYNTRTSIISRESSTRSATVSIAAASGSGPGGPASRNNLLRLAVNASQASAVSLNGAALTQHTTQAAFNEASAGWFNTGDHLILAKSGPRAINTVKTFNFTLQPAPTSGSANFICNNGWTSPGEDIYVTGSTAQLGNWNPAQGIRLNPSVYYEYIYNPPPAHAGPGPSTPVWTRKITGLPTETDITWKCVKKLANGGWQWQSGSNNTLTTTARSYNGHTQGSF